MTQDTETAQSFEASEAERRLARGNLFTLEVLFLGFVAAVVLIAFVQALGYKIVSSRTPFVIMVPLFVLIAIHARRLWRVRGDFNPRARLADALGGRSAGFASVVDISAWMVGLVAMIAVLGHYIGLFVFCVILMRFRAGETWKITLLVAAGTVLFIFGVFEYLFNIDLYRGLIIRYFLGFRDF